VAIKNLSVKRLKTTRQTLEKCGSQSGTMTLIDKDEFLVNFVFQISEILNEVFEKEKPIET